MIDWFGNLLSFACTRFAHAKLYRKLIFAYALASSTLLLFRFAIIARSPATAGFAPESIEAYDFR